MHNKGLHIVSFTLVVVGALNWGLVGLFGFNLVEVILGAIPALERIVYVLVGLAAVYLLATHKHDCRTCNPAGGQNRANSPGGTGPVAGGDGKFG